MKKYKEIVLKEDYIRNGQIYKKGSIVYLPLKEDGEKWIQKADMKKGALHKKLGIPEDQTIPMSKIDSELEKLHKKTKSNGGEGLSADEETFEHELQAAKNMKNINKESTQLKKNEKKDVINYYKQLVSNDDGNTTE